MIINHIRTSFSQVPDNLHEVFCLNQHNGVNLTNLRTKLLEHSTTYVILITTYLPAVFTHSFVLAPSPKPFPRPHFPWSYLSNPPKLLVHHSPKSLFWLERPACLPGKRPVGGTFTLPRGSLVSQLDCKSFEDTDGKGTSPTFYIPRLCEHSRIPTAPLLLGDERDPP